MLRRNPWTGINPLREFLYDLRHPRQSFVRVLAGVRGENPHVSPVERWVGLACLVFGVVMLCAGFAVVLVY